MDLTSPCFLIMADFVSAHGKSCGDQHQFCIVVMFFCIKESQKSNVHACPVLGLDDQCRKQRIRDHVSRLTNCIWKVF